MIKQLQLFLCFFVFSAPLVAEKVETFYGSLEVEEPVLLELIASPAMQRLKNVHQYGVSYYITYNEEYNRYDHSLGVFAILRAKGASLEEQIAGLLHDVSHTVFSHVGDWIYGKENQEEDYQNSIHNSYLIEAGIDKILEKYGYTVEQVDPKRADFIMLEQPLPNLCADRIDYNIQGAYFQNFLTKEEAVRLFNELTFDGERWLIKSQELAEKIALFSIYMTRNCWGSAINHFTSLWLAEALQRAVEINLLTLHDLHFGVDNEVWPKLEVAEDAFIRTRMWMITHFNDYIRPAQPDMASHKITFRCRAIDPWIVTDHGASRLTAINSTLAFAIKKIQEQSEAGWPVSLLDLPSYDSLAPSNSGVFQGERA